MLHKLRHTFSQSDREQLSGLVEIDETYAGGLSQGFGHRGRSLAEEAVVIIACEVREGGRIGWVRMGLLPDATKESITAWVQTYVAPKTAVHTDGWGGYNHLSALGYHHKVTVESRADVAAHIVFPRVHTVASLLKRWLLGTHQGGQQQRYLDRYHRRVRLPVQPPECTQPRAPVLSSARRGDDTRLPPGQRGTTPGEAPPPRRDGKGERGRARTDGRVGGGAPRVVCRA
jgi:hypothetical protein